MAVPLEIRPLREAFGAEKTTDLADGEVDLGEPAAGVMVVGMDLDALDKGGVTRFSREELRNALLARGDDGQVRVHVHVGMHALTCTVGMCVFAHGHGMGMCKACTLSCVHCVRGT